MRVLLLCLILAMSELTLAEDFPCEAEWLRIKGELGYTSEDLKALYHNAETEKYRRVVANTRWQVDNPFGKGTAPIHLAFSSNGCTCKDGRTNRDHVIEIRKYDTGKVELSGCAGVAFCVSSERDTPSACSGHDVKFTGGAPLRNEDFK